MFVALFQNGPSCKVGPRRKLKNYDRSAICESVWSFMKLKMRCPVWSWRSHEDDWRFQSLHAWTSTRKEHGKTARSDPKSPPELSIGSFLCEVSWDLQALQRHCGGSVRLPQLLPSQDHAKGERKCLDDGRFDVWWGGSAWFQMRCPAERRGFC